MRIYILYECGRIFLHIKEVCFLAGAAHGCAAVGTLAVLDLSLGIKGLAGLAVPALIFSFIYIALAKESFKYLLYRFYMAILRRADKAVVFDIHKIPHAAYLSRYLIDVCLGIDARLFGIVLYLLTVLVRACAEIHIVTRFAAVTRQSIRDYRVICVAYVRLCRCIGNSRGDIISVLFLAHYYLCPFGFIIFLIVSRGGIVLGGSIYEVGFKRHKRNGVKDEQHAHRQKRQAAKRDAPPCRSGIYPAEAEGVMQCLGRTARDGSSIIPRAAIESVRMSRHHTSIAIAAHGT